VLVIFDINDTLLNHGEAERVAATLVHRSDRIARTARRVPPSVGGRVGAKLQPLPRRGVSFQRQRRDRVREMIESPLSDDAADHIFAAYLLY